MSKLNRFTGMAWQIEKHYTVNEDRKNCRNCEFYYKEGSMCRKHNEHISYNAAQICIYFNNVNVPIILQEDNKSTEEKKNNGVIIPKKSSFNCQLLITPLNDNLRAKIESNKLNRNIDFMFSKGNALLEQKLNNVNRILSIEGSKTYCYTIKSKEIIRTDNVITCKYQINQVLKTNLIKYNKLLKLQDQVHLKDPYYNQIILVTKQYGRR